MKNTPLNYDDIPRLDEIDTMLCFVSEEVLYATCKDPNCKSVHVMLRHVGEPYVVGATFSLLMAENLLRVAKVISNSKTN